MTPGTPQICCRRSVIEAPVRQGYARRAIQEGSGMDALLVFGILVLFIFGGPLGGYYAYVHYGVAGELGILAVILPMTIVLFALRGRL
jgi:hypothetical protein